MSDPTRERILAAFDRELEASPLPPGLRERSMRGAIARPVSRREPRLLALVAAVIALALIATLVIGTRLSRQSPIPAHSNVPPAPRSGAAVAYDQAHGELVVFGGLVGSGKQASAVNETWTFDGKRWTHQHPAVSPPPNMGGVMAYDLVRHQTVLLANPVHSASGALATWIWNGSTWRQIHPAHAPPTLSFASEQFDPITETVLLYGSSADQQPQMWSWNGSDWIQLQPATLPTAFSASMVFDGEHVLLLSSTPEPIGGRFFTQTWTWDGSTWNLLNPARDLPVLGYPISAAYDVSRDRLVLLTGDTWTWDRSTWIRQHPTVQPPTVGYMAYIPSLREVVSWGSVTDTTDGEMYAWNGTDWTLIQPGPAPETTNGKGGYAASMSPAQAAAIIRSTVKNSHPVLLPNSFPGGPWDATVDLSSADDFTITYRSDQRDKTITVALDVANPPPGDADSSDTFVKFRNSLPLKYQRAGYAEYFVYDPSNPLSQRWLTWIEPGASIWTNGAGAPYFLGADGLTDQEFWQVANSLK